MDLPRAAGPGGHQAGDLPQSDGLVFARPVMNGQLRLGIGELVFVLAAEVIGARHCRELAGGHARCRALAPGQQVKLRVDDVGEQGRTPVSLHDALPGTDRRNASLVVNAVAHAAGLPDPHP